MLLIFCLIEFTLKLPCQCYAVSVIRSNNINVIFTAPIDGQLQNNNGAGQGLSALGGLVNSSSGGGLDPFRNALNMSNNNQGVNFDNRSKSSDDSRSSGYGRSGLLA